MRQGLGCCLDWKRCLPGMAVSGLTGRAGGSLGWSVAVAPQRVLNSPFVGTTSPGEKRPFPISLVEHKALG